VSSNNDDDCLLIATLHTEGDEPLQSFMSFTVIDYNSVYEVVIVYVY